MSRDSRYPILLAYKGALSRHILVSLQKPKKKALQAHKINNDLVLIPKTMFPHWKVNC